MIKVMFVCLGNICRSPMAEYVLKYLVEHRGLKKEFEIASSATSNEEIGNDIHYATKAILRENNITFNKRSAVRFTKKDYDYYDYILVMEDSNIIGLKRIIGQDTLGKIHKLMDFSKGGNIADPWYTGNFDKTYKEILTGCTAFLDYLQKEGAYESN